jgi:hypothetical protein
MPQIAAVVYKYKTRNPNLSRNYKSASLTEAISVAISQSHI